jgi:hypothetical protein
MTWGPLIQSSPRSFYKNRKLQKSKGLNKFSPCSFKSQKKRKNAERKAISETLVHCSPWAHALPHAQDPKGLAASPPTHPHTRRKILS